MKILFIVLIVLIVWLLPLATIWALNTLFPLSIAYTLKTWAAALLLSAAVGGSSVRSK